MGNQLSAHQWTQLSKMFPADIKNIQPIEVTVNYWQLASFWASLKKKSTYKISSINQDPISELVKWAKEYTSGSFFAKLGSKDTVIFYFLEREDEIFFRLTWSNTGIFP